jgi:hypothetical protein
MASIPLVRLGKIAWVNCRCSLYFDLDAAIRLGGSANMLRILTNAWIVCALPYQDQNGTAA